MSDKDGAAGCCSGGSQERAVVNRNLPHGRSSPPTGLNRRSLDILLDDEDALRQAVAPLVALARRRNLAPPTEEATMGLLDALCAVRRWRRAVEAEVMAW